MPPLEYMAANAEGDLWDSANGSIVLGLSLSLGFARTPLAELVEGEANGGVVVLLR